MKRAPDLLGGSTPGDQLSCSFPMLCKQMPRGCGCMGINMMGIETLGSQTSYIVKLCEERHRTVFRVRDHINLRFRVAVDRRNLLNGIIEALRIIKQAARYLAPVFP